MKVVLILCFIGLIFAQTIPANDNTVKTRACQPPLNTFPFCDTSLSIDQRVQNLISLIHDDEKPYLLTARNDGGGNPGPGNNISRIGLPEYDWGVNCIHGAQTSCVDYNGVTYCPTSFPNPVNYGMTFNSTSFSELGKTIATELRALWVMGATEADPWTGRKHGGLDCWSPNINLNRDPRWGRNMETPSEDPTLNGDFGQYYTSGLQQGEDPKYIKVIVTLKHWDAYSLEDSDGFTRHNFNAVISNYTLYDSYFPAFQAAVTKGNAKGIMCSYNAINGVPTCANPILSAVLKSWNFTGYITSDTGAIEDIYSQHKYVPTAQQAACKAITDGRVDINSGAVYHNALLTGVTQKYCTMDDVNKALYNTLKLRFELGLFDPIEAQPYWHVPATSVNNANAKALNLLSTLESMVLLKNDGNLLPFAIGKKVAVIGPNAASTGVLLGNYLGQICPSNDYSCVPTVRQGIQTINTGGSVTYELGCPLNKNDTSGFTAAVNAAKAADYVVLVMGIDTTMEGESRDRTSIDLPYIQHQLIAAIVEVKKPTVLVLLNGGSVSIEAEKTSVPAIIEAGYPGTYGAEAIARTIFGQNDHLGGKLPYTIYPANYINQVKMSYMELEPKAGVSPGRTYRFYTGPVVYPFGHGLTYTTFKVTPMACNNLPPLRLNSDAGIDMTFTIANTGTRTGDEVIMAYVSPTAQHNSKVIKKLIGYKRIHLEVNQQAAMTFTLNLSHLQFYDRDTLANDVLPGIYPITFTNGVETAFVCPINVV